ncbi:MAG: hypothetical protein CVV01_02125, partial [Firmicutes bacterium HGW-Firmicutes-6]
NSGASDYSVADHWLKLPEIKYDVDIFYLYPTAWKQTDSTHTNYCEIDDATMMLGSASAYARQATAFEPYANVFAPYYRQADAQYILSMPTEGRDTAMAGIPTIDATAAFSYYIEHYNNGRPFILAGHSQGSNVLLFLLADYMKQHPDVYQRMVAAYVIGYPVTADYLASNTHLKFANGADDTGVIISYNTQSPNVKPGENIVTAGMVGLVINPIIWTRDETPTTVEESLGSFMPNSSGQFVKIPYADAQVDIANGVLICNSANEEALSVYTASFGPGVYHSFDYPFYYYNIQENAKNRADKFLSK